MRIELADDTARIYSLRIDESKQIAFPRLDYITKVIATTSVRRLHVCL